MSPVKELMHNCMVAALAYVRVAYELGRPPATVKDFESALGGGLRNPITNKFESVLSEDDQTTNRKGRITAMIVPDRDGEGKPTGDIKAEFIGHDADGKSTATYQVVLAAHGAKPLRSHGGIH